MLIGAFAGVTIIALLFFQSFQLNRSKNGFIRIYLPKAPTLLFDLKTNYKIRNIAGTTANSIYVSATDSPLIECYDKRGRLISKTLLHYPPGIHHPILVMDSTNMVLFDGDKHTIFRKKVDEDTFRAEIVPGQIFTKALMLRSDKIVLRQFIDGIRDQNLVVYDLNNKTTIEGNGLTKLYYDSGMAEEGKLYYDISNQQIIYVFNKRNSFLVLDTNLCLKNTGKTIDTISNVFEKVKRFKRDETYIATNAAPTLIYNKASAVAQGILYHYSKLKADNEEEKFVHACNIDQYDLKTLKYLGSFYLPKLDKEEVRSMTIDNGILYAVYSYHLAAYKID